MSKRKICIIAPYPLGEAPSQRFRFEQYVGLFSKKFQFDFHPFFSDSTWEVLYTPKNYFRKLIGVISSVFRRAILLFRLYKYDVVFIHREAAPFGPPIFEWITTKIWRKNLIYDFDDAIWIPNSSDYNRRIIGWLKFHSKVRLISKWAKVVSVGNDYLYVFASRLNNNVIRIPTTIDTEYHVPRKEISKSDLIIGWTGTHSTMKYFDGILPVLEKLNSMYDFKVVVISNQEPSYQLDNLEFIMWSKETEISDLARFDIGIMPLEADIWSEGKCGFKALQYMAMGIPCVVSPVGVNTTIVTHNETGFHASNSEDWLSYLSILLEDDRLRKTMGAQGRQFIVDNYSVASSIQSYQLLFKKGLSCVE